MKLYSLDGPSVVEDPEFGTFTSGEDDAIVGLPDELYDRLHRTHVAGKKVWENEAERDARLVAEDDARRKDPATLLAAVERLQQPSRELTAAELRDAHEERKRIRAEEEAAELARVKAAEDREQAEKDAIAKAEKDKDDARAAAEQAEADRIAGLPVKAGDTVKLAEPPVDGSLLTGSPDHPDGEPADTWRGVVTEVVAEPEGDTTTDVASFEGQSIRFGIDILEVVDVEAEAKAAEAAKAEQERIDAEAAKAAAAPSKAADGTSAPTPPKPKPAK